MRETFDSIRQGSLTRRAGNGRAVVQSPHAVVRPPRHPSTDRLRRDDAEKLGQTVANELGLTEIISRIHEKSALSPEREQKMAWDNVKELVASRAAPAEIVAAVRKRFQGHYDAEEVKLSWFVLTETDPMVFVRVVCLLPYLPDGSTDPIARGILEAYMNRLMHEKYAAIYNKVLNALKNLHKVKSDSPALLNFIALVKWIDAYSAGKITETSSGCQRKVSTWNPACN